MRVYIINNNPYQLLIEREGAAVLNIAFCDDMAEERGALNRIGSPTQNI